MRGSKPSLGRGGCDPTNQGGKVLHGSDRWRFVPLHHIPQNYQDKQLHYCLSGQGRDAYRQFRSYVQVIGKLLVIVEPLEATAIGLVGLSFQPVKST